MAILVERVNIGIFGRMNAGKSSLMNLITQHETSIVDPTPGTTADTKTALFEVHGLGPVRLFDTAGIDESSVLGEKKKEKVLANLKECNLALIVIDPSRPDYSAEQTLISDARHLDLQILIVYNLFDDTAAPAIQHVESLFSDASAPAIQHVESLISDASELAIQHVESLFSDASELAIQHVESAIPQLSFYKKIRIQANNPACREPLLKFILAHYEPADQAMELLPFVKPDAFYVLIIPMDDETPPGRFLRPQAMTEEYITRHWAYPVAYRLNLSAARSQGAARDAEHQRFTRFLDSLKQRPHAMITDSQAMDIMKDWCPEDIGLTTFSIVMIHYMSGGRLAAFAQGVKVLSSLREDDVILIAEACNHSRIGEDIGTVQIPGIIQKRYPGVTVEHAFGRMFQTTAELKKYALVIHCGGCMISRQKMTARLRDLEAVGIPFTNYGVFLSAVQGPDVLARVLIPWGIDE
jgi:small GTP-binding protein